MNINLDDIAIVHNENNEYVTQITDENNNVIWKIKRPKLESPLYSIVSFDGLYESPRLLSLQDYTCHWEKIKNITLYKGNNFSNYLWTDGTDIYYSYNGMDYLYDRNNKTFNEITFNTRIDAMYIWTDGTNIFYSYGDVQKVYDKETRTWLDNTFTGTFTKPYGNLIWTDGTNIFYDLDNVYDKNTKEFVTKNLNSTTLIFDFHPIHLWRNFKGDVIYTRNYADNNDQWVRECYKFESKIVDLVNIEYYWTDYTEALNASINGSDVWTDGRNIYCSGTFEGGVCFKLDSGFTNWSDFTEWNCNVPPSENPSTYYPNHVWTDDLKQFKRCTTNTCILLKK